MKTSIGKVSTKSKIKKAPKKASKTWQAYLEAKKTPGKIVDMRAVLK